MKTYEKDYVFNFFVDNPKEIRQGTQRMIKTLIEYIAQSDCVEIQKMLHESKQMRYSIQGYEEETDIAEETKAMLINAGYASALLDAMQLYVEKMETHNEILKVNTKYRDTILRTLAARGTLLHKDLASMLGVSPSGLNAIINQMNVTSVKLINVEQISKYTLYSITPVAYKYITKKDQEHFPEREKPVSKGRLNGYWTKCKEQEFVIEQHLIQRDREEQNKITVKKVYSSAVPQYGDKLGKNAKILPYKQKLA